MSFHVQCIHCHTQAFILAETTPGDDSYFLPLPAGWILVHNERGARSDPPVHECPRHASHKIVPLGGDRVYCRCGHTAVGTPEQATAEMVGHIQAFTRGGT